MPKISIDDLFNINYEDEEVEEEVVEDEEVEEDVVEDTEDTEDEVVEDEDGDTSKVDVAALTKSIKDDFAKDFGFNDYDSMINSRKKKGSLGHMTEPKSGGSPSKANERALNDEEREFWKYVVPGITEEELDKKRIAL